MTRVFLAAGVAALAITAPANAGPKQDRQAARAERQQAQPQRQQAQARPERQQPQRFERQQLQQMATPRIERQQRFAVADRPARAERQQLRAERVQPTRVERQQAQVERVKPTRVERQQPARTTVADRQQLRANRVQQMQTVQARPNRVQQTQTVQVQPTRTTARQEVLAQNKQLRADRQMAVQNRIAARSALATARLDPVRAAAPVPLALAPAKTTIVPVAQAVQYVGQPVNTLQLSPVPQTIQYLYPDTPNYYYQYGDGYLYQVDRTSSLISALIPLLAGGYMPGQYLPTSYMNSYAPDYWGLNSFYPASYGTGYGYGYDNLCNRYADGVIYQVDCYTGMVVNVIPMYAGGYGVGQMIPSSYSYYNVPSQYRSLYYDTPDYNYWYAPGAIYQYDPQTSLISSVAALLSPGFTVGQQLPMGYSTYNVPYDYRSTYYDTPTAMYRYNNGYIYQIDPTTQIVSAIVASILT